MFGRIVCLCVFCGHFCFMPVICKWIHLSGSNPWLHNHENVTTCICASIIESSVFILSFSFFTLLCRSKEVGIGSVCRLTNSVTKLFVFFDNPLSGLPGVCCRWGGGGWGVGVGESESPLYRLSVNLQHEIYKLFWIPLVQIICQSSTWNLQTFLNPPCTDYLSIFNMKFTNFSESPLYRLSVNLQHEIYNFSESPLYRLSVNLQHEIYKLFQLSKCHFPHNPRHLIFSETIHPEFKNNNTSTNKVDNSARSTHWALLHRHSEGPCGDLWPFCSQHARGALAYAHNAANHHTFVHRPRPQNHAGQLTPEGQKCLWAGQDH